MGNVDCIAVARAYNSAWVETQDLDTAYEAAAAVFRQRHPEVTDPAIVACLVAIIVSGVIGDILGAQDPQSAFAKPKHPPVRVSTAG